MTLKKINIRFYKTKKTLITYIKVMSKNIILKQKIKNLLT